MSTSSKYTDECADCGSKTPECVECNADLRYRRLMACVEYHTTNLINRNERRNVPEEDEEWLREQIDDWVIASGRSGCLLHVPCDTEPDQPVCKYALMHGDTDWITKPVEVYPVGHRDVCRFCFEEFERQLEKEIR